MKKYLNYVIIILVAVLFVWLVNMHSCGGNIDTYNPKSIDIKDSVNDKIDSLNSVIDSLSVEVGKVDSLKALVDGTLTDRKEAYDKFENYIEDSDADTAFQYIINYLDSTERKDL